MSYDGKVIGNGTEYLVSIPLEQGNVLRLRLLVMEANG